MDATEQSTQEAQKSLLDRLCNPRWPDRWSNRIMLVIVVFYFFVGLPLWEVAVDQPLAEVLDLLSLAILSILWIVGDELLSRFPGSENRRPAFGTRALKWVRQHWPERRSNQVVVLILIAFILLPVSLWESANNHLNGALDFISLPGLLVLWLVGDVLLSRRPGNEDRKPAFATRMKQRLWPYRPQRQLNRYMGIYSLLTMSYWLFVPIEFIPYTIYDATIALELFVALGIVQVWLVYVLARCWANPACQSIRLLGKVYGFLGHALISILIFVSLITTVTNEHGITYLHIAVLIVGFGFMVISALTPESLLRSTSENRKNWFLPCVNKSAMPAWW